MRSAGALGHSRAKKHLFATTKKRRRTTECTGRFSPSPPARANIAKKRQRRRCTDDLLSPTTSADDDVPLRRQRRVGSIIEEASTKVVSITTVQQCGVTPLLPTSILQLESTAGSSRSLLTLIAEQTRVQEASEQMGPRQLERRVSVSMQLLVHYVVMMRFVYGQKMSISIINYYRFIVYSAPMIVLQRAFIGSRRPTKIQLCLKVSIAWRQLVVLT